jgi:GGDEF domain-containing protein
VARDISERRASQARIAHMAQHDMLTELPNRAVVSDRLSQALAAARRNGHRVGLLYIDLDRFKPVNDAYGHAVGDQLLRQAAIRMRGCVRESDTVARFGGDEFVVLLPSSTPLPMRPPSPRRSARPSPLPSTWPACGSRCRPASVSRYIPTTAPTRPR